MKKNLEISFQDFYDEFQITLQKKNVKGKIKEYESEQNL
ncbi:hypothetical protein LEP1GSC021_1987 [Leptospira noguchii str. 1993005606]|uniref:Uncharacterized protein n=4 Tax=Leptospira noguchii TaxID=28182 RepID=M6Y525_9LEPT|nr:hypothetical protein LEP1GSC035_3612 [Leptospira noguchii str. 2007001578]EMO55838.1 hypothetical protein LEP1GSC172_0472 [Leptospira noguchii]EMO87041.1 hypothetical protein LEP1GSC024_0500 [Leptospira noguchii str. 2001034031]EPE86339.1 hypothetical protein LEP1GSC021_1987 [Leptospira noguchii str. 1993005606]EQA71049.1 hypothetical protein LEP1GSC059_3108 [Leptospira noguchii serovar Panama str. CZ214]